MHRKALTPADFPSVAALEQRLKWFQWHYNRQAQPFRWNYTSEKLEQLVEKLELYVDWMAEARQVLREREALATAAAVPATN